MHPRLADIGRHGRRVGAQLLWVCVALLSTSGGEQVAVVAPPAPAIVELPIRPVAPPHVTVAPAPSIIARVVAGGEPVVDAEVSISDGSKPLLASARTDRDGIVRFADLEPGAYELWASQGTSASSIVRAMDVTPDTRVDIVLDQPAAALRGHIEGEGGLPEEATVQLVPMDLDHATRVATVDPKGAFELAGVPHGTWRVEVSAPGHVQMTDHTVAVTATPDEVIVRLQRTGIVSGTVVDARGTPIPNATIMLRDQAGSTATQRPVSLTASRLRWIHPLAGTRVLPSEGGRFGAVRPGSRPAECGRGHCGLDLGMERGSIVHVVADGQIAALFPDGRSEAGRYVVVQHGGGLKSLYMHLDEIRPGLEIGQSIRAGDPVGILGSTGIFRSAPHLHFAITHESAGRTWYLDPEPMIRAAVVLAAPRPYDPVDVAVAAKGGELAAPTVATITSDDKGSFRVEGVAPGAYVAAAFATDLAPGVSSPFSVRSGDDVTGIVVQLSDGVLVRGRVMGRDGPIAGATVIAGAGMGETAHKIATAHTDKYGEYSLRSLGGKLTLTASAPAHGEVERAITVIEGREQQREDFKLVAEDAQLRGVVLEPDGGAGAGVSIRIVEGFTRRRTTSDSYGRFTIPVASGRYVVELSSIEHPPKRFTVEVDRFVELRLDAGGGARALVRDAHSGAAITNVRVEATGPGGLTAARNTDHHGLVELRGLKAGEWKLSVRAAGYLATSQQVTVRSGRGLQDATLELVRGATLAGEVRDRFGRRVAGARVTIGDASTVTHGDGQFRITGAQSGTLQAESEGRTGTVDLRLTPGDERLSITINLSE